jgi:hypothetical protein
MKKNRRYNPLDNSAGLIVADFLFSFVMVLGIGIFIFGITFSLAVIEVGQYVIWSTARNYAAGNKTQPDARASAEEKFNNLTAQFPLLSGSGGASAPWFEMSGGNLIISDKLADDDPEFVLPAGDKLNDYRQPWTGVRGKINLKLFAGLQIPFLKKVADDPSLFEFPIRAFIIRHPSKSECQDFFYRGRFPAIQALEAGTLAPDSAAPVFNLTNGFGEDNGC